MRSIQSIFAAALGCLAISTAAHAATSTIAFDAPKAGDLVPTKLVAGTGSKASLETEAVSFAWALDPQAALTKPAPYLAKSLEFYVDASQSELVSGLRITTTAPGAVLRLSPKADGSKLQGAIGIADVGLRQGRRQWSGADAFDHAVDGAALKAAGMDLPQGSLAFRVKPELGAGPFELVLESARRDYLLHVFEPQSSVALGLALDRSIALIGDPISVDAGFSAPDGFVAESFSGLIMSPDGSAKAFSLETDAEGRAQAQVELPAMSATEPGLVDVHVFAAGTLDGEKVLREARTAIAVAFPNGRFAGTADVATSHGKIAVSIPVEVSERSRFNASAVLYATKAGVLAPVAISHSAAELVPGAGSKLMLEFAAELIPPGFGAPYALHDLTLSDQGRMATVEERAVAIASFDTAEPAAPPADQIER